MAKTQHKKEVNRISKTTIILYLVVIIIAVGVLSIMGAGQTGGGSSCCDCSSCTCICCDGCLGCLDLEDECQCVNQGYRNMQVWNPYTRQMQSGDDYWCDLQTLPAEPAEPACDAYCPTGGAAYSTVSDPEDCPLQFGVCKGATQDCVLRTEANCGSGYWKGCKSSNYNAVSPGGNTYEADEITCDGKDNDCDGEIDEGCDADEDGYCSRRMLCKPPKFDCDAGQCTDCDDNNALKNPDAEEVCDGIDNDCDHKTDEGCGCSPEGAERVCEKTQGVCLGAKQTCKKCEEIGCEEEGQLTGWTDCDYGANYMEGGETGGKLIARLCQDGIDNDCDNLIDCADGDCRRFCKTTAP